MACTSYVSSSSQVGIRVLFTKNLKLYEYSWNGKGWQNHDLGVGCIPGTKVAMIGWGRGDHLNFRVYFQKGEHVTGISEWMWTGGNWKAGRLAIPPAPA